DHFDAARIFIKHHLGDFRRRQGIDDEGCRIGVPRNDVDALALQLLHDGLDAHAAHADASAHRIDGGILGDHRDLGAAAGIARHSPDFDDAIVDFRHLLREETRHELGMRAREEYLRPARFATHIVDVSPDAIAVAEGLARDHLIAADHAFGAAEIHHHRT